MGLLWFLRKKIGGRKDAYLCMSTLGLLNEAYGIVYRLLVRHVKYKTYILTSCLCNLIHTPYF